LSEVRRVDDLFVRGFSAGCQCWVRDAPCL
jgi:hypothetical protein